MKSGRKNFKTEKSTKMRYRGIMFEIDRTDFQILTAFKVVDEETVIILDKPTDGITIAEIMEYLDSVNARKSRKTVYLHLQKLMKSEYVKKGIVYNHADSYYIAEKGKNALKGDL